MGKTRFVFPVGSSGPNLSVARRLLTTSKKGMRKGCFRRSPYETVDADLPFPENVIILQVRPESVWTKKEAKPKTKKETSAMDRVISQLMTGARMK